MGIVMKKMGMLLICMLALTCCLYYVRERHKYQEEERIWTENASSEGMYDAVEEEMLHRENAAARGLDESCYAYSRLGADEQKLYLEILDTLTQRREEVRLSSCDTEQIARIFQSVMNDHPEIFYVDGYTYTEYMLGETLRKITFTGVYTMTAEEMEEKQRLIDAYTQECLDLMPQQADEYEKVKYIYEYLILHTQYDAGVSNNQNICSVFLDHKSVCQGYAKAMQYLLQQADVYATLVLGSVIHGESHAWNLVRIDGAYYYVDVTWGDASYQASDGEADTQLPEINYDYLCVTTDQLESTHRIDNVVELPECTAVAANYYVREDVYFTEYDETKLERVFAAAYERGDTYITLKCATGELYRCMKERLIEQQGIFAYLQLEDDTVSYAENDKQYSMSFWLS